MLLTTPQPLGELALLKVYFEHDGPRLFSASRPDDDALFLAMCVDEDDEQLSYLYWSVTPDDLLLVERGAIALLDSVNLSEQAFFVVEDYSEDEPAVRVTSYSATELPDRYLPTAGAKLSELRSNPSLASSTAGQPADDDTSNVVPIRSPADDLPFLNAFSMEELNLAAQADHHFYAAIELQSHSAALGTDAAVNLRTLSTISGSIQELVYAIGNESLGFVRTGETVNSALDLSVYGARAASFVLILRTPEQGVLFDGEISRIALRGLTSILMSARSPDEVIDQLRQHKNQVRRRVRELLTVVTETGSDLMAIVTDGTDVTWGRVNRAEAAAALDAITAVPATIEPVTLTNVLLTALNLTRKTFEVWDRGAGQKYSGSLSEEVLGQVDGLTVSQSEQLYNVRLEVETDFARDRNGPARRVRLLAIAASE